MSFHYESPRCPVLQDDIEFNSISVILKGPDPEHSGQMIIHQALEADKYLRISPLK